MLEIVVLVNTCYVAQIASLLDFLKLTAITCIRSK